MTLNLIVQLGSIIKSSTFFRADFELGTFICEKVYRQNDCRQLKDIHIIRKDEEVGS